MDKKIYLTLLILTISTLIISIGCGGGSDNGVIPSSLPDSANNNQIIEGGYIKVKVVWPQDGIEGRCIFTSGENEITASIPRDTHAILVTVHPDPNDTENTVFDDYETQWHLFEWDPSEDIPSREDDEILHPLPAVRVIVKAVAYNQINSIEHPDPNSPPIIDGEEVSSDEVEVDILLGEDNYANLSLGEYDGYVRTTPDKITFPHSEFESKYLLNSTTPPKIKLQLWVRKTGGERIYLSDREVEFKITNYTELGGNIYFIKDNQESDVIDGIFTDTLGVATALLNIREDMDEIAKQQLIDTGQINIQVKVFPKDPEDRDLYFVEQKATTITIENSLLAEDNFEGIDLDPNDTTIGIFEIYHGSYLYNKIDPNEASDEGQSLLLHGPLDMIELAPRYNSGNNLISNNGGLPEYVPEGSDHFTAIARTYITGFEFHPLRYEIRVKVKNGDGPFPEHSPGYYPDESDDGIFSRAIFGLNLIPSGTFYWSGQELIRFTEHDKITRFYSLGDNPIPTGYSNHIIASHNYFHEEEIGIDDYRYTTDTWYTIVYQYIEPDEEDQVKIEHFWVEDENDNKVAEKIFYYNDPNDPNTPPWTWALENTVVSPSLASEVGDVWFDEFSVYDLHSLPLSEEHPSYTE